MEALLSPQGHRTKGLESASMLGAKWRRSILLGALFCGISLLVNVIAAVYAARQPGDLDGTTFGRTVFRGDCTYARRTNTAIHLAINLLSTVLLASSNYAMQCISAPTRVELDRAHARKQWLDIGVPSIRNLGTIAKPRTVVWILLAVSSLPLHLVYNSVFHLSLSTNKYYVFQATNSMILRNNSAPPFIDTPSREYYENFGFDQNDQPYYYETDQTKLAAKDTWTKLKKGTLQILKPDQCIQKYTSDLLQDRQNLILVTNDHNNLQRNTSDPFANLSAFPVIWDRNSVLNGCNPFGYGWACYWNNRVTGQRCDPGTPCSKIAKSIDPKNWTTMNYVKVDFCLSDPVPERCAVRFTPSLAWVVISFNALKLVLLLMCCMPNGLLGKDQPLLTTGDAVASFLGSNDDTTRDLSAMDYQHLNRWRSTVPGVRRRLVKVMYPPKRPRLLTTVPIYRWLLFWLLFLGVSVFTWYMFSQALDDYTDQLSPSVKLSVPFGSIDTRTMLDADRQMRSHTQRGFIRGILLANLSQLALSLIYSQLNRIITTLALSVELHRFTIRRKGLRVSTSPRRAQRSAYFLQVPYRVALPVMLASALLHWLCSQSFFLVSIIVSDPAASDSVSASTPTNRTTTAAAADTGVEDLTWGYSPQALLVLAVLLTLSSVVIVATSVCRFESNMPVSGSCSAVLSAMCHPVPEEDGERAAVEPLMWGVVEESGSDDDVRMVQCAFSSREVRQPTGGDWVPMLPKMPNNGDDL